MGLPPNVLNIILEKIAAFPLFGAAIAAKGITGVGKRFADSLTEPKGPPLVAKPTNNKSFSGESLQTTASINVLLGFLSGLKKSAGIADLAMPAMMLGSPMLEARKQKKEQQKQKFNGLPSSFGPLNLK